jgi:hypothetical protein
MHPSAGFDCGLDQFALLVDDVTGSVKDVRAWSVGTILKNNLVDDAHAVELVTDKTRRPLGAFMTRGTTSRQ